MAKRFRRLIIKPPAAPPEKLEQLAGALEQAIRTQNTLAGQSPYVLQFVGPLQEDERAFYIEHESASAWSPADLFDSAAGPASNDQLLHTMAAIFDALQAAARLESDRPVVHGGLCPGVLLTDPDGFVKVTDFGFAPAVCRQFDTEAYKNLAVGPHADGSGAWEILAPSVTDRDDRLWSFIDPAKYAYETLNSFELGSDVIAAGLILHLMAEHVHPYLSFLGVLDVPAHRVVQQALNMGLAPPWGLFRNSGLTRSDDPAMADWAALVVKMVNLAPKRRPSVDAVVSEIRKYVPPLDRSALLAEKWVTRLDGLLAAEGWDDLEAALDQPPAMERWPEQAAARVAHIRQRLEQHRAELAQRQAIAQDHQTARTWFGELETARDGEDWDAVQARLDAQPTLEHWPADLPDEIQRIRAQLDRARALQAAREWRTALAQAVEAGDWAAVSAALAARPQLAEWPQELSDFVIRVEQQFAAHVVEQALVQREHAQAEEWLARAQDLYEREQWDAVLELVAQAPEITHWPPRCRKTAEALRSQSARKRRAQVDEERSAALAQVRRETVAKVQQVVTQRFASLLAPERVDTTVVAPDDPASAPEVVAHVTVQVMAPTSAPRPAPIRAELRFQLSAAQARCTSDADEFNKQLGEGLTQCLPAVQQAQLAQLQGELRSSVFPELVLQASLPQAVSECSAAVHLLGKQAAQEKVDLPLGWNPESLMWRLVQPETFRRQALDLAAGVTKDAIIQAVRTCGEGARTYASALTVELQASAPPASKTLPSKLTFEARVSLRPGAQAEPVSLVTLGVTTARVGQQNVDLDAGKLEAALAEAIRRIQNDALRRLGAAYRDQVRGASGRVKFSTRPATLERPDDLVVYTLTPASGEPVELPLRWSPEEFTYETPPDCERTLADLVAWTRGPKARALQARRRKRWLIAVSGFCGLIVMIVAFLWYLGRPRGFRDFLASELGALDKVQLEAVFQLAGADELTEGDLACLAVLVEHAALTGIQVAGDTAQFQLDLHLLDEATESAQLAMYWERAQRTVWQPEAANDGALDALRVRVHGRTAEVLGNLVETAGKRADEGNLLELCELRAFVAQVCRVCAVAPESTEWEARMQALPSCWDELAPDLAQQGYHPASGTTLDAATGYPLRLTDAQGRTLRLVAVAPQAAIWQQLQDLLDALADDRRPAARVLLDEMRGSTADDSAWRLFYIDEVESHSGSDSVSADQLADAEQQATDAGRRLPTRAEWALAALVLHDEIPRDMLGGKREWCAPRIDDSKRATAPRAWVCGGVTVFALGQNRDVPDGPGSAGEGNATLLQAWQWLVNPLVMRTQQVDFGGGVTGFRTLLPIYRPATNDD